MSTVRTSASLFEIVRARIASEVTALGSRIYDSDARDNEPTPHAVVTVSVSRPEPPLNAQQAHYWEGEVEVEVMQARDTGAHQVRAVADAVMEALDYHRADNWEIKVESGPGPIEAGEQYYTGVVILHATGTTGD